MARRITTGEVGGAVGGINITNTTVTAAENLDITFDPSGTGIFKVVGDAQIDAQGDLRFADADSSNYVGFQAPSTVSSNVTWTLPGADGTATQAIVTNGSGTLSFATVQASITDETASGTIFYPLLNQNTSGTLTAPRTSSTKLSFQPSTGTMFNPIVTGGTGSGNSLVLRSTTNATKGQVYVDESTASSSTSTGALRVLGGVGVGGAIYASNFFGDGAGLTNVPSRGRLLSVNVYTTQNGQWNSVSSSGTSGTWNRPSGCTNVLVYVTGGGGGCRHNNNAYRGAGGGGGATAIRWLDVTNISSVSVTAGGGGGHNYGGRGNTGGTSSFGPFVTATGGQGGITDNPYEGGPGGDASGGDVNLPGGGGEMSHGADREGGAGMSFWFKAGSHHMNQNSNIEMLHGQWGGGGAYGYYSDRNAGFGNGGGGCVIVYNYS
jgi:hypothetical protein